MITKNIDPQMSLFRGLNPEQLEAVTYRGPALLIVAGAGSGKTRVLTHRVAGLLHNKEAWPSQILAITFTNKAASEMRERVESLVGASATGMWISTFHSACVRILRKEAERFGYGKGFTIYDSQDSRALLKGIIKDLEADTYGFTPANAAAKISKLKNELRDAETYRLVADEKDPRERIFLEIFTRYENDLKKARAFDFDDLIGQTVFLFRAFPEVAAVYRRKFRHILVDEYQDTNHAQYSLIKELTKPVGAAHFDFFEVPVNASELDEKGEIPPASLTVVGDSDQSIYAFRGADIRNIVEFERDYLDARVIKLEQNYRSTQTILDAANAVIENNMDRQAKKLWSDVGAGEKIVGYTGYSQHDEARFVADEIDKCHQNGIGYKDMAILYRTNAQTRALEEFLIRGAIPYRILGGTKFYERAEIKDALAYLVSIANPYEPIAWSRLLGAPKRGIGPMAEAQLAVYADENEISFHEAMLQAEKIGFGPKLKATILALGQLLNRLSALATQPDGVKPEPVADILKAVFAETQLIEKLREKRDPQDEARAENLEELLAVAKEFDIKNPELGLVDFLTEVSLVAAADELDDSSGTVSLMTLHTAKGLEYETVFLTGLEEGLMPHQMSVDEVGGIAEERRLMYVGLTRAKKQLYITLASSRAQFGDIKVAMPSRFLQEIPPNLIEWKQTPGEVTSQGGASSRALNSPSARSGWGKSRTDRSSTVSFGGDDPQTQGQNMKSALDSWRERKKQIKKGFPNTVVSANLKDNSGLELRPGDYVEHEDYGKGRVENVTGEGSKKIAHTIFDSVGERKLLIKLSPIKKIEN